MARTDANHTHGIKEAIERAQKFSDLGAEILFVEAPKTEDEMKLICKEINGYNIANIVEGGVTPNLSLKKLEDIGYKLAVYPLTTLSSSMKAIIGSLRNLKSDNIEDEFLLDFMELRDRVGFNSYYKKLEIQVIFKRK